ncbi:hypothetical protein KCTC52924_02902 [Arenibacter antarcticus]|uniref:Peptidoglycan bridge formation glycyltransferase FemA/FemB family protein n=1 Tax=Arenibacter antarcticus TaxID=2040469 RepID=A0ABW5VFY6_9FLAO|nr:peptidoglycan bridge formation glycyltransferase FemA/FemB family protein [Arenibacter sp. H213]MCM4167319.1 GNAT family N-acetyltransferase [Arenibacter sp. H213]
MTNIVILDKKREWDNVIESCDYSDFYHTYEYHCIARNESDQPILIKYSENDKVIALPLLLRKIKGTKYQDATSVYGYSGPVTKNIYPSFNNSQYTKALQELFLELNIISVFSRLNPFIPNQKIVLNRLGEVSFSGNVVYIDLKQDLETQKRNYNRRLKSYINKSRKEYTVKVCTKTSELEAFIELYYENMKRVNASKSYFFSKDYFFSLFNSQDFKTEVLIAIQNASKKIIAGAMFVKKNTIIQYHLSGSSEEFLYLNPVKMLIDEMRIKGTKENYQYYNLGGGLGGVEDSLFRFKSGFSKDLKEFELWKYIINQAAYDQLYAINQQREGNNNLDNLNSYFPAYRWKNKD